MYLVFSFIFVVGTATSAHSAETVVSDKYKEIAGSAIVQAYTPIQQKLRQLADTYVVDTPDDSGRLVKFMTENTKACPGGNRPGTVYQLTHQSVVTAQMAKTGISHTGCGRVFMKEQITIEGANPKPWTAKAVASGERPSLAPEGQDRMTFEIFTGDDQNIFRLIDSFEPNAQTPQRRYLSVQIKDRPILTVIHQIKDKRLTINTQPAEVSWLINGRLSRGDLDIPNTTYVVETSNIGLVQIIEGQSGERVSANSLTSYLSQAPFFLLEVIVAKSFFQGAYRQYLPESSFARPATAADRLRNDMLLLIDQIQAGNTALVVQLLRNLLNSIESGEILDQRPAQK